MTSKLYDACIGLRDFPEGFPIIQRFERFKLRKRIAGPYLIMFRTGGSEIMIIRLVHGATDYNRLLDEDFARRFP